MSLQAYPLQWPAGWPRARSRKSANFGTTERKSSGGSSWTSKSDLTMAEAMKRLRYELERLGVKIQDDMIVSTNLKLNLNGLPRGDQGEPGDPGVAVYWQTKGAPMRVLAIDAYTRVRDNVAAVAKTLEAMRAIERHGGAQILERAFTGFTALAPPKSCWDILGISRGASAGVIQAAYVAKARAAHPDAGGSDGLGKEYRKHGAVNHSQDEYVRYEKGAPVVHSNSVEGYFSIFKRGMKGVYQHCSEKHLHRYLAEFDFRYSNRVALGVDDKLRAKTALQGAVGKRLTYRAADSKA